jgi:hypothetical protein
MLSGVTFFSMIGSRGSVLALGVMAVKTFPPPLKQAECGHLARCSSISPSFSDSSEITFIRFDFSAKLVTGKLTGNEMTKAHEKTGCGVAMDGNDCGGRPSGCSGNKHPQQIHLLARAESTSSCIHLIILFLLLS